MQLSKLCKEFCKEHFNIKLVFNSLKVKNYFSYKEPIPNDLKSFVVYKFICASCSSSYFKETCRRFKTRIEEDIKKDNKSHIFKHLRSTATCLDSYNYLFLKIIAKVDSKFDLKIKEALHIKWIKPNLNAPQKSFRSHPFTIASIILAPFCLCLFFFCRFLHFSFIYCFHYLYTNYRPFFLVLITLCYYFISL